MRLRKLVPLLSAMLAVGSVFVAAVRAQQFSALARQQAEYMLQRVADDVHKHYYDPKFHGVDMDEVFAQAKQRIANATSMNAALLSIGGALDELNDTHTFFVPPPHATRQEYGWRYEVVGDRCFVTEVKPKSDADRKGVKPGDEVLAVDGFPPTRETTATMQYVFGVLRPEPALRVILRSADGQQRTVDLAAHISKTKLVVDETGANGASDIFDIVRQQEEYEHLDRVQFQEYGDDLIVMKIPRFDFSNGNVSDMIAKARKYKALILDLRGNPGGSVEALARFLGGFFDKDVKIADRVGRKENKPIIAKANKNPFTGRLVVLIDSRSGSAAELFARVVQLEKRGVVLGDRSSGSVMEARHYNEQSGMDVILPFGVSVTEANLIMSDGKSLEHVGVTPDQVVLPTAADLATGRDPVIARAAELLGQKITPEAAGKLFPFEWPPE